MPYIPLRSDLYGITSLLDYRKEAAAPLCELTDILLAGESTLSKAERETIATYVSYLNDCEFCSSAHGAVVCELSGNDGLIRAMKQDDIQSMDISDKMKSLLNLAGKVQKNGNNVTQDDVDAAKKNGATDLEVHDTVMIAAVFCLYNRYVDGLSTAVPPSADFYEALGKRIAGRGYSMPTDGYHALKY